MYDFGDKDARMSDLARETWPDLCLKGVAWDRDAAKMATIAMTIRSRSGESASLRVLKTSELTVDIDEINCVPCFRARASESDPSPFVNNYRPIQPALRMAAVT
jgi:hypothetical protein